MRFSKSMLFLLLIIGLSSCTSESAVEIKAKVLEPYKIIDQVSDSTFFDFVLDIVADDSIVLFLDYSQMRMVVCDHLLNEIHHFGRRGKGPGELVFPSEILIHKEEFYIRDNKEIKKYSFEGDYLGSIGTEYNTTGAYAIDENGNYFVPSNVKDGQAVTEIDEKGKITNSFGLIYNVPGNDRQKLWFQQRDLFLTHDKLLLAVGRSYPSVELYNLDGELIFSQQLEDPIIVNSYQKTVEGLAKEPLVMVDLYNDTYVYKNRLYALKGSKQEEKLISNLLVWDISKKDIKLINKYQLELEDDFLFFEICLLSDSTLVAFESISKNFCFFRLD